MSLGTSESGSIPVSALASAAKSVGLELYGVLSLERFNQLHSEERTRLERWQNAGFAGEMRYMERDPDLFGALAQFLPGVRSIAAFAVPYHPLVSRTLPENAPAGFGRVARYAWGRDYHLVIRDRLACLIAELKARFDNAVSARPFTDAVPLLERAIATQARLGFIGKNCMLIRPGVGSYTFLAELLLDTEVDFGEVPTPGARATSCGSCQRCLTACPTAAFTAPHQLDARRCISYLTIEKRTPFSEWEAEAIGDWIFGCDRCQEVCPFNHAEPEALPLQEFGAEFGVGPYLELQSVLAIPSRRAFERRFAGSPVLRARREGLLRNACAVAANTRRFEVVAELQRLLLDRSELLRTASRQALARLEPDATGIDRLRILGSVGGRDSGGQ